MSKEHNKKSVRKELIELLLEDQGNKMGFIDAFNDFLLRMPDIHASGQGSFFDFHFFYILGGIYSFIHSPLKQILEVSDIGWKLDKDRQILHFAFKKGDSFKTRTFLFGDVEFNDPRKQSGKIFRISPREEGGGFEIKQEDADSTTKYSISQDQFTSFTKVKVDAAITLEASLELLASTELDLDSVKTGSKQFLKDIGRLYQDLLENINLPKILEAMQHGFFYGALTFPFKNKYHRCLR